MVATDYLTKFAEVRALKTSVKNEVARFVYERIVIRFGIPLEIVSDNGPQFISDVWKDLMERLAIKHRLTTMYKPSTNGLVERTNKILCSMIAKETETKRMLMIGILKFIMQYGHTTLHSKRLRDFLLFV